MKLSCVPAPLTVVRRLRSAVSNTLVRERDRLADRVALLESRLQYFVEYRCDRCAAVIGVSSSIMLNPVTAERELKIIAAASAWCIEERTHLCPRCDAARRAT